MDPTRTPTTRHGIRDPAATTAPLEIRPAGRPDVTAISRLVTANVGLGHLLPRTPEEIERHVSRFLVATLDNTVLGCGELAPLSERLSEIRSLVVAAGSRGTGIGTAVLAALVAGARRQGVPRLCAFTHVPHPFVAIGFSIVPHTWLPEKIMTDCQGCEWFRRCEQTAVVIELGWGQSGPRGTARTI
ncbi:MAG: GNAT family N-acetyltransferase [Acidobacteria bacterium]|nr:GNAT family N-acetyltransferase [Acidobacteriota bacterium]TDI22669.1 MAG: GNAT family N-acetyltransferase [Acidobacteriota bacterium]